MHKIQQSDLTPTVTTRILLKYMQTLD